MALLDEWVAKAEGDAKGAATLHRRRKDPLSDLVCFHCQQCVEKYLKALLLHQGDVPPRIHDLTQLLRLVVVHDRSLQRYHADAHALDAYAVMVRYPGVFTGRTEAMAALGAMRKVRRAVRRRLGF